MSGFIKYLNKIQSGHIEEEEVVEEYEVVVETVKPKAVPQPLKKKIISTPPQKVDASVSIIEARIKSKLDEVGLNSKLINEVVSFVLSDVKNVKDLKVTNSPTSEPKQQRQPNINEFAHRNDIAGASSHILEGVRDIGGNINYGKNEQNNNVGAGYTSNIADHASSLL
jgi:hypothetical protein